MITFSRGAWISVPVPKGRSKKDLQFYATIYAAAHIHGPSRAAILAEVAVNKRLYPGIMYDSRIEADLKALY